MIRRAAIYLLLAAGTLLLVAVLGAQWVLRTEAGANWVWARATAALPDSLAATSVAGTLRGGLQIDGLKYSGPGVGLDAERVVVSVDPDLWPLAVTVQDLQVRAARITLLPAETPQTDAGADAASLRELLGMLRMPLTLRARGLELIDTRVIAADGSELITVDTLALSADLHEQLTIEDLRVIAAGAELHLDGHLALSPPFALDANVGAATTKVAGERMSVELALRLQGNLERVRAELESELPQLDLSGTISELDATPEFQLQGGSARIAWPPGESTSVATLSDLKLSLSGSLDDYRLVISTRLDGDITGELDLAGEFEGSLRDVRVLKLDAESQDFSATARGEVAWAEGLRAQADIDLHRLDAARWVADWPEAATLSGRIDAAYANSGIAVRQLRLQHDDHPATLTGRGTVDIAQGTVDAALEWQALQWPLAPATASIDSERAELTVSGDLDDWQLAGDIALGAPNLPSGRFSLQGGGDRDSLSLDILDSAVLDGTVTGRLAFNWRGARPWSAALQTRNISITPLAPAWPGRLSTRLEAEGQLQPLAIDAYVEELSGELRSRPVRARGRLRLTDGVLQADEVLLHTADARLQLDGSPLTDSGLRFDVDVPSLADLLPGATGVLQASGRLRTGETLPLLALTAEARDLAYRGTRIGALDVRNAAEQADAPFRLTLRAEEVVAGNRTFESVDARLDGTAAAHTLAVELRSGDIEALAELRGAAEGLADASAPAWNGSVQALRLAQADSMSLALREPANVEIMPGAAVLSRACIDADVGGAICGSGRWQRDGGFNAAVELGELPLDLVRLAINTELEFTQSLDGAVELSAGADGELSGTGRIEVAPGLIRNRYDERLTLRTRAGYAAFTLQQGQLLAGEISLPFSDAAEISGTFNVEDISLGPQSPVTGLLQANVRNIGVGARIVPMIDDAGGRLEAEFRAAGTLGALEFNGGMTLRDGYFAYDPLGLRFDDIQVDSQVLPGNRVEVQSTFRAGDGYGELSTSADYLRGTSAGFELALRGSGLRLIDLDDLSVSMNPDLRVGLQDNNVSINGRIVVPDARLASVNLVDGGVSESDDVVFVDDTGVVEGAAEDSTSPMEFSGEMELVLGERVVIDLDVAEARVGGSTTFTWNGPPVPQANGGFDVAGKFEAYGQLLEITEGLVRFPGVPADNPELRIRAEREIFGNSQVRNAGVLVTGTAQRPQVDVYTTPATTKDRALTLLATGSDFDYEQGVGAVDVGRYIAPRLYASYGVGLFDKDNVISVRYDLAKGFGVKATSGKSASGIDISYTIER